MIDETSSGRALSYLLILAIEELLDFANRAAMRYGSGWHVVSRQIARLHVLEEARHVSFAKTYLTEVWPTLGAEDCATVSSDTAPRAGRRCRVAQPQPGGLRPPRLITGGAEAALANPRHRANVVAGLGKLTVFLTELGVIGDVEPVDRTRPHRRQLSPAEPLKYSRTFSTARGRSAMDTTQ